MSETAQTLPANRTTALDRSAHDRSPHDRFWGMVHGGIGMAIFAGSLPATRAAVLGFDAGFVRRGPFIRRRRHEGPHAGHAPAPGQERARAGRHHREEYKMFYAGSGGKHRHQY